MVDDIDILDDGEWVIMVDDDEEHDENEQMDDSVIDLYQPIQLQLTVDENEEIEQKHVSRELICVFEDDEVERVVLLQISDEDDEYDEDENEEVVVVFREVERQILDDEDELLNILTAAETE